MNAETTGDLGENNHLFRVCLFAISFASVNVDLTLFFKRAI